MSFRTKKVRAVKVRSEDVFVGVPESAFESVTAAEQIHARAVEVSVRHKKTEAELIEVLQEVERHRVFVRRGHSSLFAYVTAELGLAEGLAYTLITVARKAREVPQLMSALRESRTTLSNARREAAVLTPENQQEWVDKACHLSSRQLEKEIARVRPREATPERVAYVNADRVAVELGMSERDMLRLRRVQDLLCQAKGRPVSLEEAIGVMSQEFLRRNDPVEKAKRHQVKKGMSPETVGELSPENAIDAPEATCVPGEQLVTPRDGTRREPIPARVRHTVNARDGGRCTYVHSDGSRCNQTRWLDLHHRVPVSQGGDHSSDNLTTLCKNHHAYRHLNKPGAPEDLLPGNKSFEAT